jgi:hypothetical protein
MDDLIRAVRDHAVAHYNDGGWDFLVECWSDADIRDAIGSARTVAGAIRNAKRAVGGLDERRREVRSEIF